MNNYRPFAGITPAVKIIIIINVLVFLAINMIGQRANVDLVNILGMHLPQSQYFQIYQYITHMFTQKELTHLFFNMFAVFMFGRILESVWGTKRFIIYYFVTGLGAAALHSLVSLYGLHNMQEQFYAFQSTPDAGVFAEFVRSHVSNPRLLSELMQFVDAWNAAPASAQFAGQAEYYMQGIIQAYANAPTIGASGAVFGILFCDLNGDMEVAEAMIKHIIRRVMERCPDDLAFFNSFVDKGLLERLQHVESSDFGRVTYTEAVKLLKESGQKFDYPVEWGIDLQTEHERYLTEQIFKRPVFVTDYPQEIKAFYMRLNDDGKTVAAADCLVPGIGEIIGGSQREERIELLEKRIRELGMNRKIW